LPSQNHQESSHNIFSANGKELSGAKQSGQFHEGKHAGGKAFGRHSRTRISGDLFLGCFDAMLISYSVKASRALVTLTVFFSWHTHRGIGMGVGMTRWSFFKYGAVWGCPKIVNK
jgi:hypothetical protein